MKNDYRICKKTGEQSSVFFLAKLYPFTAVILYPTFEVTHRWVDIVFPELRQVFKILTYKGALLTLRLFPLPSDLCKLNPDDVIREWQKSMKRLKLCGKLARLLVGVARSTEAYNPNRIFAMAA
ncbi:hypothetical protein [Paenibacillus sp. SI8]|uniref:hypothetical protein n=1 Tax=unclassified Paenibacillus TaxID=185978 RepID=UPI00346597CC